MRRGTTPTITLTVGCDLTDMNIYVALKQAGRSVIVKTGDDLIITPVDGGTQIEVTFTQEETLALSVGKVDVQIRATQAGGAVAIASNIASIDVGKILQDGVLT